MCWRCLSGWRKKTSPGWWWIYDGMGVAHWKRRSRSPACFWNLARSFRRKITMVTLEFRLIRTMASLITARSWSWPAGKARPRAKFLQLRSRTTVARWSLVIRTRLAKAPCKQSSRSAGSLRYSVVTPMKTVHWNWRSKNFIESLAVLLNCMAWLPILSCRAWVICRSSAKVR